MKLHQAFMTNFDKKEVMAVASLKKVANIAHHERLIYLSSLHSQNEPSGVGRVVYSLIKLDSIDALIKSLRSLRNNAFAASKLIIRFMEQNRSKYIVDVSGSEGGSMWSNFLGDEVMSQLQGMGSIGEDLNELSIRNLVTLPSAEFDRVSLEFPKESSANRCIQFKKLYDEVLSSPNIDDDERLAYIRIVDFVLKFMYSPGIIAELFPSVSSKNAITVNSERKLSLDILSTWAHSLILIPSMWEAGLNKATRESIADWNGHLPTLSKTLEDNYNNYFIKYDLFNVHEDITKMIKHLGLGVHANNLNFKPFVIFSEVLEEVSDKNGENPFSEAKWKLQNPKLSMSTIQKMAKEGTLFSLFMSKEMMTHSLFDDKFSIMVYQTHYEDTTHDKIYNLTQQINDFLADSSVKALQSSTLLAKPFDLILTQSVVKDFYKGNSYNVRNSEIRFNPSLPANNYDVLQLMATEKIISIESAYSLHDETKSHFLVNHDHAAWLRNKKGRDWPSYYPASYLSLASTLGSNIDKSTVMSGYAARDMLQRSMNLTPVELLSYMSQRTLLSVLATYASSFCVIYQFAGAAGTLTKLTNDRTFEIDANDARLKDKLVLIHGDGHPYGTTYDKLAKLATGKLVQLPESNVLIALLDKIPVTSKELSIDEFGNIKTPRYYFQANENVYVDVKRYIVQSDGLLHMASLPIIPDNASYTYGVTRTTAYTTNYAVFSLEQNPLFDKDDSNGKIPISTLQWNYGKRSAQLEFRSFPGAMTTEYSITQEVQDELEKERLLAEKIEKETKEAADELLRKERVEDLGRKLDKGLNDKGEEGKKTKSKSKKQQNNDEEIEENQED